MHGHAPENGPGVDLGSQWRTKTHTKTIIKYHPTLLSRRRLFMFVCLLGRLLQKWSYMLGWRYLNTAMPGPGALSRVFFPLQRIKSWT